MAADQGDADAQYHIGFMYNSGKGVVKPKRSLQMVSPPMGASQES